MWHSIGKKTHWIILLAALCASFGAVAADKVYISVDESGQPKASDRPPAGGNVEEVIALPKTAQPDASKTQEEVQRINQMTDQMAAERKQKQNARAAAKDQEERQQVACAASRSRLQQLESQPPNRRLVTDPDGTTRRVSAEEMQAVLAAARRQVAADCGGLDAPAAPAAGTAKKSAQPSSSSERNKSPGSSERQKSSGGSERQKASGSSERNTN